MDNSGMGLMGWRDRVERFRGRPELRAIAWAAVGVVALNSALRFGYLLYFGLRPRLALEIVLTHQLFFDLTAWIGIGLLLFGLWRAFHRLGGRGAPTQLRTAARWSAYSLPAALLVFQAGSMSDENLFAGGTLLFVSICCIEALPRILGDGDEPDPLDRLIWAVGAPRFLAAVAVGWLLALVIVFGYRDAAAKGAFPVYSQNLRQCAVVDIARDGLLCLDFNQETRVLTGGWRALAAEAAGRLTYEQVGTLRPAPD